MTTHWWGGGIWMVGVSWWPGKHYNTSTVSSMGCVHTALWTSISRCWHYRCRHFNLSRWCARLRGITGMGGMLLIVCIVVWRLAGVRPMPSIVSTQAPCMKIKMAIRLTAPVLSWFASQWMGDTIHDAECIYWDFVLINYISSIATSS